MRSYALTFFIALACLSTGCAYNRDGHVVVLHHTVGSVSPGGRVITIGVYRVWLVGEHGNVVPFPHSFPDSYLDSVQGSTKPSPSPDGRWIAYGDRDGDYDVRLLDVRTHRQQEITHWGKPPTVGSVSVDVLIGGWSPDSRMLLLVVARGEDTSEEGHLAVPKASYGFYTYDVQTGTTRPVMLPSAFQFVAWLPDGRFVGVVPGSPSADDKLVILRPGESRETTITSMDASPYQSRVSADRQWLVGLHSDSGGPPGKGTAQIVKLDLATMAVTSLVPLGWWSGNERPAISPDDKHVAYKREKREHKAYYTPQESLLVDGRAIYACSGTIDFKWVGDRMIALACRDEALVLDTSRGRILGTYKLAPPHTRN